MPKFRRLRSMLVASAVVASYWSLCIFIALINPPARIVDVVPYAGAPVGDRSEEFRVEAARMGSDVPGAENLTWYYNPEDCGFRYSWAKPDGAFGQRIDLSKDTLCTIQQTPDFYAVEGVTTFAPYVDSSLVQDKYHETAGGYLSWYKFSDGQADGDLLRHTFETGITSEQLGISSELFTTGLLGLFLTVSDVRGPYTQGHPFVRCPEVTLTEASCEVVFDFEGDQSTELRNSSARITADILVLLDNLAKSDTPPPGFSAQNLADDVCQELTSTSTGAVEACLVGCKPAYPYGAGMCTGSYSVPRGGSLPGQLWGVMFLVLTGLAMIVYIAVGKVGGSVNGGISYLGRDASIYNRLPPPPYGAGNDVSIESPFPRKVVSLGTAVRANPSSAFYPPLDRFSDNNPTGTLEGGPMHALGVNVALKHPKVLRLKEVQSFKKPILTLSEDFVTAFRNIRSSEIDEWFDPRAAPLARAAVANNSHFQWRESYSVEESLGGVMLLWTTWWVTASSGWGGFYWLTALVFAVRMREETDIANLWMSLRYGPAYLPQKTLTGGILPLLLAFMELATDADLPGASETGLFIAVISTGLILGGTCRYVWLYGHNPRSGTPWAAPRTPEEVAAFHRYTGSVLVFFGRWTTCLRCGDIGGELATMLCLADTGCTSEEIGHVTARTQLNPAKRLAMVAGHML